MVGVEIFGGGGGGVLKIRLRNRDRLLDVASPVPWCPNKLKGRLGLWGLAAEDPTLGVGWDPEAAPNGYLPDNVSGISHFFDGRAEQVHFCEGSPPF